MLLPVDQSLEFLQFLLDAKSSTYASLGDDASVSPLLAGSRQLEWREGPWLYRDIYFGTDYFVGQETISWQGSPVWSMGYAGGVVESITSKAQIKDIYSFLRSAMQQISLDYPYRGPQLWQHGEYLYTNQYQGGLNAFWGQEVITSQGNMVYELHYGGGFLK